MRNLSQFTNQLGEYPVLRNTFIRNIPHALKRVSETIGQDVMLANSGRPVIVRNGGPCSLPGDDEEGMMDMLIVFAWPS